MFVKQQIRPVIYDFEQLDCLAQFNSIEKLNVWLKVDTGMGRLGFHAEELPAVRRKLDRINSVGEISLMTHLANADKPERTRNKAQLAELDAILNSAKLENQTYHEVSVLNSAGILAFPEHAANIVRPGLMLYGISPQSGTSSEGLNLRPVMSFKSCVISVRRMPAGSTIGYGGTYTLAADSRIAYIACGYGDGYPRHACNGTTVSINDLLVPLVGRVSMDIIAVDIGELPVNVGDTAVLWGADNPIEGVAAAAETIPYELTCNIAERVERRVI